jgi:Flp pilus assembly pilin Flp
MALDGFARGTGQGVVEYGIILGLIALLILIALVFFGDTIGALLAWLGSLLP